MKNNAGVFKLSFKSTMILMFIVVIGFVNMGSILAQDLIILKTGEEIKSKVTEVGTGLIKYKKFENLTGPDYTIEKNKVFMVKYENGTKDVFNEQTISKPQTIQTPAPKENAVQSSSPKLLQRRGSAVKYDGKNISKAELRALMAPYPEVLKSYNTGKTLSFVGDCFAYTVIGVCIITAIRANDYKAGTVPYQNAYKTGLTIAIPLAAVGITISIIGGSKIRSSINLYNSKIQRPVTYNLNFGIQESGGVGFALKF